MLGKRKWALFLSDNLGGMLKKTFMSGFVSGALRDKLLFYYSYSYFLF
jgi:hypothetical protein